MRLPTVGGRPTGGRINGREVFGLDRRRRPEGRVVQRFQVFRGGAARMVLGRPTGGLDPVFAVDARVDQGRVDAEGLAADQPLGDATRQHGLEQTAKEIAVAKAAMAALRTGRMVRDRIGADRSGRRSQRQARFR
jgi:hypothetical protein